MKHPETKDLLQLLSQRHSVSRLPSSQGCSLSTSQTCAAFKSKEVTYGVTGFALTDFIQGMNGGRIECLLASSPFKTFTQYRTVSCICTEWSKNEAHRIGTLRVIIASDLNTFTTSVETLVNGPELEWKDIMLV